MHVAVLIGMPFLAHLVTLSQSRLVMTLVVLHVIDRVVRARSVRCSTNDSAAVSCRAVLPCELTRCGLLASV